MDFGVVLHRMQPLISNLRNTHTHTEYNERTHIVMVQEGRTTSTPHHNQSQHGDDAKTNGSAVSEENERITFGDDDDHDDDDIHPPTTATNPSYDNNYNNNTSMSSVQVSLGTASLEISKWINDHLMVVRTVTIVAVSTLGLYAVTQTPLFFRYRNVTEIPAHVFQQRKTITGRLVILRHHHHHHYDQDHPSRSNLNHHRGRSHALQQQQQQQQPQSMENHIPVTCYVRHLSPIESLLSTKWWRRYWNLSRRTWTASSVLVNPHHHNSRDMEHKHDENEEERLSELIQVQIAGIEYPHVVDDDASAATSTNGSRALFVNGADRHSTGSRWNTGTTAATASARTNNDTPTLSSSSSYGSDWIRKLSQQQCVVRCQFLARQGPNNHNDDDDDENNDFYYKTNHKRPIPGMAETTTRMMNSVIPLEDRLERQAAIVKLYVHEPHHHHPSKNDQEEGLVARMKHWWRRRRDVGEIMVQNGYAVVAAQGLFPTSSSSSSSFITPRIVDATAPITTITDTSTTTTKHTVSSSSSSWSRTTIQQQRAAARHDVRYWHQLTRAEYQAVQSYAGIWSHPQYRQERSNVVDERHFQQQHQSSMIQKFFRWIRGA